MKKMQDPKTKKMISQMSKIKIQKNALTATHTKAIVLSNQSCAPFIYGYDANMDYDVI
jgi:hypothetical protein